MGRPMRRMGLDVDSDGATGIYSSFGRTRGLGQKKARNGFHPSRAGDFAKAASDGANDYLP